MTKAVIFDLDGLLINSEVISFEIYKQMVQAAGQQMTVATYARDYSGRPAIDNMRSLVATFALPYDVAAGLKRSAAIEAELLQAGVALKPGATTLLKFLRTNGYQIALATSSDPQRARKILTDDGIFDYFDSLTYRDDVQNGKPQPDIFLKAAAKIGQQPGDCLVLEDSEAGIQAAHAAQIPVVCIPDMKRPGTPYAEWAAAILPSLADVVDYLAGE